MRKSIVTIAMLVASLNAAFTNLAGSYALDGQEKNLLRSGLSENKQLLSTDDTINNLDLEGPITDDKKATSSDYQPSSCQLVPIVHLLKHPGCHPKAIASFACSGSCPSYVKTSTSKFWRHERSCSCCQQTGSQEATFALDCPSLDPPYRKVKTHTPVDCLCRACTDLSRENLRPQELVEALASEMNGGTGFSFQTS